MLDDKFKKLVDDHGKTVLNAALRILGNHDSANDVYQEVFLAIWQRRHSFNGDTNWPAYLYRVAIRKALDNVRSSKKTVNLQDQDMLTASGAGPDEAIVCAELDKKLRVALAKLPKRQADVFIMARFEGLSYSQIAESLGCSQETARVHMHRAMKSIAGEFKDYRLELK